MKALWILAAAASLAACHHQTEDEMGAAPQRDTTAVAKPADTTQVTQPTAPAPTPADTGMKVDTTSVNPNQAQPGAVTPDTSGAAAPAPAPTPSPTDTSSMGKDSGMSPSVDTSSTKTSGDSGYSK